MGTATETGGIRTPNGGHGNGDGDGSGRRTVGTATETGRVRTPNGGHGHGDGRNQDAERRVRLRGRGRITLYLPPSLRTKRCTSGSSGR